MRKRIDFFFIYQDISSFGNQPPSLKTPLFTHFKNVRIIKSTFNYQICTFDYSNLNLSASIFLDLAIENASNDHQNLPWRTLIELLHRDAYHHQYLIATTLVLRPWFKESWKISFNKAWVGHTHKISLAISQKYNCKPFWKKESKETSNKTLESPQ